MSNTCAKKHGASSGHATYSYMYSVQYMTVYQAFSQTLDTGLKVCCILH